MRGSIVFSCEAWARLAEASAGPTESAGIAIASEVRSRGPKRLLVRSVFLAGPDDYVERSGIRAVLAANFVAQVVARARQENQSVVFFHTHPFETHPAFSRVDDAGESLLREFVDRRLPGRLHAAVVVGTERPWARVLGSEVPLDVDVVGHSVTRWEAMQTSLGDADSAPMYDRQRRALGAGAQERLRSLRIAVVGLGGTGSLVAQQLAHLGVRDLLLVDPDVIESSNLNRVVGAEPDDASFAAKVEVAKRHFLRIQPNANVTALRSDVTVQADARHLLSCDLVFGCTDSHGSRYVLNQLAYQYFLPVIDMGVAIVTNTSRISHVFGRVQLLAAGMPCLTCLRTLDPEQVRRELLSPFERQRDPYIIGIPDPQPAVISINSTVSSLAVTMMLATFAGVPLAARHQVYDGLRGMVRPLANRPIEGCVTCSHDGGFARGDDWPMPGRLV